ncbi:hypothetical protein JL720_11088 [Aureococcus anophagefferens]|nr:hypothetical protein JL720_11088 [Aureococcus anophagefferens]
MSSDDSVVPLSGPSRTTAATTGPTAALSWSEGDDAEHGEQRPGAPRLEPAARELARGAGARARGLALALGTARPAPRGAARGGPEPRRARAGGVAPGLGRRGHGLRLPAPAARRGSRRRAARRAAGDGVESSPGDDDLDSPRYGETPKSPAAPRTLLRRRVPNWKLTCAARHAVGRLAGAAGARARMVGAAATRRQRGPSASPGGGRSARATANASGLGDGGLAALPRGDPDAWAALLRAVGGGLGAALFSAAPARRPGPGPSLAAPPRLALPAAADAWARAAPWARGARLRRRARGGLARGFWRLRPGGLRARAAGPGVDAPAPAAGRGAAEGAGAIARVLESAVAARDAPGVRAACALAVAALRAPASARSAATARARRARQRSRASSRTATATSTTTRRSSARPNGRRARPRPGPEEGRRRAEAGDGAARRGGSSPRVVGGEPDEDKADEEADRRERTCSAWRRGRGPRTASARSWTRPARARRSSPLPSYAAVVFACELLHGLRRRDAARPSRARASATRVVGVVFRGLDDATCAWLRDLGGAAGDLKAGRCVGLKAAALASDPACADRCATPLVASLKQRQATATMRGALGLGPAGWRLRDASAGGVSLAPRDDAEDAAEDVFVEVASSKTTRCRRGRGVARDAHALRKALARLHGACACDGSSRRASARCCPASRPRGSAGRGRRPRTAAGPGVWGQRVRRARRRRGDDDEDAAFSGAAPAALPASAAAEPRRAARRRVAGRCCDLDAVDVRRDARRGDARAEAAVDELRFRSGVGGAAGAKRSLPWPDPRPGAVWPGCDPDDLAPAEDVDAEEDEDEEEDGGPPDTTLPWEWVPDSAAAVRALAKAGCDVRAGGDALLHHCVRYRLLDAAEALLEAGCDANARDGANLTPLHYACSARVVGAARAPAATTTGQGDAAEALLEAGADAAAADVGRDGAPRGRGRHGPRRPGRKAASRPPSPARVAGRAAAGAAPRCSSGAARRRRGGSGRRGAGDGARARRAERPPRRVRAIANYGEAAPDAAAALALASAAAAGCRCGDATQVGRALELLQALGDGGGAAAFAASSLGPARGAHRAPRACASGCADGAAALARAFLKHDPPTPPACRRCRTPWANRRWERARTAAAAAGKRCVAALLALGADPDARDVRVRRDAGPVASVLAACVGARAARVWGAPPLHECLRRGAPRTARELLAGGADATLPFLKRAERRGDDVSARDWALGSGDTAATWRRAVAAYVLDAPRDVSSAEVACDDARSPLNSILRLGEAPVAAERSGRVAAIDCAELRARVLSFDPSDAHRAAPPLPRPVAEAIARAFATRALLVDAPHGPRLALGRADETSGVSAALARRAVRREARGRQKLDSAGLERAVRFLLGAFAPLAETQDGCPVAVALEQRDRTGAWVPSDALGGDASVVSGGVAFDATARR